MLQVEVHPEGSSPTGSRIEPVSKPGSPPSFLLCPPRYFDTTFLFNPWMSYRERVNKHRAWRQWKDLCRALESAGASLKYIEPSDDSSAMVFTADAALVLDHTAILLPNDGPRGDLEPALFRDWFQANCYRTESLPRGRLDGGNLVHLHDGSYAVGLKPGATGISEAYLRKRVALTEEKKVVPIGLVNRQYLHLDMVLGNVGDRFYLVFEEALYGGRNSLPDVISNEREVIFIDREDAEAFVPNLIGFGENVVTGRLTKNLRSALTARWVPGRGAPSN